MALDRMIRAVGELSYDEGSLKTIAAYVDGRLEPPLRGLYGGRRSKGRPLGIGVLAAPLLSPGGTITCQEIGRRKPIGITAAHRRLE